MVYSSPAPGVRRDEQRPARDAATFVAVGAPHTPAAAGLWPRAAALSVDLLILKLAMIPLAFPVWIVGMLLPLGSGALRLFAVVASALQVVVPLFYFAATECSGAQGTPGKRLLGLAVTGVDGERIGLERALARTAAKVLSALPLGLGFLAAAFTRDRRAAHDFIAGTRVVQRRPAGVLALVVGALAAAIVLGRLVAPLVRSAAGALERSSRAEAAAAELDRELSAIHAGQLGYARRTGTYLDFRLPAIGFPNEHLHPLSDEDLAIARELGWEVPGGRTRFTFYATTGFGPGNAYGAGPPTYSACAMSDVDGDRKFALVVIWQPPVNAAGEVVGTPPPAPCPDVDPVRLTRPLEARPGDPIGVPVRVTPAEIR